MVSLVQPKAPVEAQHIAAQSPYGTISHQIILNDSNHHGQQSVTLRAVQQSTYHDPVRRAKPAQGRMGHPWLLMCMEGSHQLDHASLADHAIHLQVLIVSLTLQLPVIFY